ncbi:MAG: HD domain-containing phosphohydrolase [Thiotrichales bacterium]
MELRANILVVDDQPENLLILESLLQPHYGLHLAGSARTALNFLARGGVADLILTDVMMPDTDGFALCRALKSQPATRDIPVIFLTSLESAVEEEKGLSLGAEDFIHKPFSPPVILARVRNHLRLSSATRQLRERNDNLERLVAERTREIVRQSDELVRRKQEVIAAQGATITAFCSLVEARDQETANHIHRTQHYVKALAEHLCCHPRFASQLNDETIMLMFKSAPLHDVGKVAIPDHILVKPGRLSRDEWALMQRHCEFGRDAIMNAERELGSSGDTFLRFAKEIAYSHHERWDGTGYPQQLAGEAIPLSARLMAVADVYDALTSRRAYKAPYDHEHAITIMSAGRARQFDPDVFDALMTLSDRFNAIAARFNDDTRAAPLKTFPALLAAS